MTVTIWILGTVLVNIITNSNCKIFYALLVFLSDKGYSHTLTHVGAVGYIANNICYLSRLTVFTILQHFFSVFQAKNQEPHSKCPLHASRDLYRIQEGNKTQEYAAKWVCNFCGKGFYSEHYLDKHFDNKHSDKLVKVRTAFYQCLLNAIHCIVIKRGGHSLVKISQGSSKIIEYLHENLEIKIFSSVSFDFLWLWVLHFNF